MTTATSQTHRRTVRTTHRCSERRPTASTTDLCDLIEAAGPLTLRDLAGGLDITTRQASMLVANLMREDCLKQDVWERYRLWGACREAA